MKKFYLTVLVFVLTIFISQAIPSFGVNPIKEIRIDNEIVQTYKERSGKWVIIHELRVSTDKFLKEIGTEEIEVKYLNGMKLTDSLPKSQPLFFPYGEDYLKTKITEGKGRDIVNSDYREFIWPIGAIQRITSRIGKRWNVYHNGVDIACSKGSVVVAAADGIVTQSKNNSGNYGNFITIQHDVNNLQSMYAHNSLLYIKEGEKVKKGQIIALSGSTGHSTGPHLHFEVRYQNIVLNPEHYLPTLPKEPEAKVAIKEE